MPSDAEVARRILAEPVETSGSPGDAEKIRAILAGKASPEEAASLTPGSAYTTYIGGPAHDYLSRLMKEAMPQAPAILRDTVVGTLAPETLTGAMISAGTMLAPGATSAEFVGTEARSAARFMPMLKRLMGPTLAGMLGGILEKGEPTDSLIGGAEGLFAGATGETLSAGSRWLARSRLGRYFAENDPKTLGTAITNVVKDFPTMQTPEQFGSAVWGGVAQQKLSDMYGKELATISSAVKRSVPANAKMPASQALASELTLIDPKGNIQSPVIRQLKQDGVLSKGPTTFDDLTQAVSDLRLKGRSPSGDPKLTLDGRQARDYADQLSQEVSSALATVSPSLAMRYQQMDMRYGQGAEMLRFLKQPGLVDEDGRLNMKLLQEAFKEESAQGINRRFSPAQVDELRNALFRGAPATATDVMRKAAQSGIREGVALGPVRAFGNLMNAVKPAGDFAGNYELPIPYLSPKAAALGAQRVGGGISYALDRPITLTAPEDE